DFHYYATYCAAFLAGYTHEESQQICYSAQLVDLCSRTFLRKIKGPASAATTQLQLELMDARTDPAGLQDITRIWASFHFLPRDLYAKVRGSKKYRNKYRLICGPNGDLTADTVELAKGRDLPAAGIAMHVVADTWAHQHFAGTPSLVINNTNYHFYEILGRGEKSRDRKIDFRHSVSAPDDLENGKYTNSVFQGNENHIMNLGHGRAGHLPDYSFIRYRYLPAWGNYEEVFKDNPSDYLHAFCQMVAALRYLRGDLPAFAKDSCDIDTVLPYGERIKTILVRRQLSASEDWKAFGEELSGQTIEDFDLEKYQAEYTNAAKEDRDQTYLGRFFLAAMAQKSMVTNRIFASGNRLAGVSVDYWEKGFKGMKDFAGLVDRADGGEDL
ncbi:MAG: hypothetical protein IJ128_05780, partial [Firmicutes bacterium]|nr:hypothetical protein [Bacillota bacterium]